MVSQIYLNKIQLNKANSCDNEDRFWMNMSVTSGVVVSKIYDKRDDFNFEIVNFHFFDGNVTRSTSYTMVYIFRSSFYLQESVLMLMTSTTETYL